MVSVLKMVAGLDPSGSKGKEKDGEDEYPEKAILEILENSRNDRFEEIQHELDDMKDFLSKFSYRTTEFEGRAVVDQEMQREIENISENDDDEKKPVPSSPSHISLHVQTFQPEIEEIRFMKHFWSPTGVGMDTERESDLIISSSLCTEGYRLKILGLAIEAMRELMRLANDKKPLWQPGTNGEVLSHVEYKKLFNPDDATINILVSHIVMEQAQQPSSSSCPPPQNPVLPKFDTNTYTQSFHTEASRETRFLVADPIHIVELLMDKEQYCTVFSSIVSKAKLLGMISVQVLDDFDGALQVMAVEFHAPSPLVPNRECYLARLSRYMGDNLWGVVDVSLESLFPDPQIKYVRRPSGCIIQQFEDGLCQVTWVEHSEVDNSEVPEVCLHSMASGNIFSAKSWLSTLVRQHERLTHIMVASERVPGQFEATWHESLLNITDRMMREFWRNLSASESKEWMPVPLSSPENLKVILRFVKERKGIRSPPGPAVVMATTFRVPASSRRVFKFLQDENGRHKWDILSHGLIVQQTRCIQNGSVPGNCVSVLEVKSPEDPDKAVKTLVQESFTTPDHCSYLTYSPVDPSSFNMALNGENRPDNVLVMPSGFSILPEGPTGEEGSMVTIVFQIFNAAASSMSISSNSVESMFKLITETAKCITAGMTDADDMES